MLISRLFYTCVACMQSAFVWTPTKNVWNAQNPLLSPTFGRSITCNLITRVLTICHVKLTQSTVLELKRFDLRSLSPALLNHWLLLVFDSYPVETPRKEPVHPKKQLKLPLKPTNKKIINTIPILQMKFKNMNKQLKPGDVRRFTNRLQSHPKTYTRSTHSSEIQANVSFYLY